MRNNSAIGREAQFVGGVFEDWINIQHDKARYLGILAHVEKTQAVAKIVHGRLIYTENGVADYIGTLEGGRSFAVEAKSRKDARLLRSEVSVKQQDHLERVGRAGGLALLLVEFRATDRRQRFAVPWLEVPWQVKRTAESVSVEDLAITAEIRGWEADAECYLNRWHAGGRPSTPVRHRVFARE